MNVNYEAKEMSSRIEQLVNRAGLYYRIFHRGKGADSLQKKIENGDGKYGENKKIQDILGIRLCLYFNDDIEIAKTLLCDNFDYDKASSAIDIHTETNFGPTRYNLIFKIPNDLLVRLDASIRNNPLIDKTFEIQIRTVLSEGWHEIEHDLRYKFKQDWDGRAAEGRALNGVFATLETADWTTLKILDELAHSHYKSGNWTAMIRSKFRLRFSPDELDSTIIKWLGGNSSHAKAIYRCEREDLIKHMLGSKVPITMNNLIYVYNHLFTKDKILNTPEYLVRLLDQPIH